MWLLFIKSAHNICLPRKFGLVWVFAIPEAGDRKSESPCRGFTVEFYGTKLQMEKRYKQGSRGGDIYSFIYIGLCKIRHIVIENCKS